MQITSGHRSYSGFLCGLCVFAGNHLPVRRKERKVLILAALFLFMAPHALAQSNLDDLRYKISNGSIEDKRNALLAIRNLHTEEASRIAIPALADINELVRASAAAAVISLPDRDATAALIIPLLNDKAEFVRIEAAFALGRMADIGMPSIELPNGRAVSALIQTLKHDKSIRVRSAAAVALGHYISTPGVEALTAVLKSKPREQDEYLRRSAARSIGQSQQINLTGKQEIATPQNFLPDKYKTDYCNSCPGSDFSLDIPADTVNTLLQVLQNPKEAEDTRREAAFALGNLAGPSVVPALRACLNSPDPYLAETCKEALIKRDAYP